MHVAEASVTRQAHHLVCGLQSHLQHRHIQRARHRCVAAVNSNAGLTTSCACLHARARRKRQSKVETVGTQTQGLSAAQQDASLSCTTMHWCSDDLHSFSAASQPTFLRQKPQLQQPTQPAPQEPRQQGHHQPLLASAASQSSPWRFLRHLALQTHRSSERRFCQDTQEE